MPAAEILVIQNGRVTIPENMRRHLGLKPRDRVQFEIEGDTVRITRAPSQVLKIYGSVTPLNHPENFTKLREDFEEGVASDVKN